MIRVGLKVWQLFIGRPSNFKNGKNMNIQSFRVGAAEFPILIFMVLLDVFRTFSWEYFKFHQYFFENTNFLFNRMFMPCLFSPIIFSKQCLQLFTNQFSLMALEFVRETQCDVFCYRATIQSQYFFEWSIHFHLKSRNPHAVEWVVQRFDENRHFGPTVIIVGDDCVHLTSKIDKSWPILLFSFVDRDLWSYEATDISTIEFCYIRMLGAMELCD